MNYVPALLYSTWVICGRALKACLTKMQTGERNCAAALDFSRFDLEDLKVLQSS